MTFDLEQHFVGPEVLEIELQRLSFWELVHRRKDNALYLEHKLNSLSWSRSDSVDQDSLQLSTAAKAWEPSHFCLTRVKIAIIVSYKILYSITRTEFVEFFETDNKYSGCL